ncbi:MAG: signal peptidase I [Gammaproteobacteria bacterium]|nr:MAG: signal peptidase I [Gammaproteobacteria bacterium]
MDFETLMVLALAACGLIWLLDARLGAPRRREALARAEQQEGALDEEARRRLLREPVLVEYARSFFPVILVVLLLRSFLVEPFRIPSGSMIPTLWVGDFILVNKFAYGIRLPVLQTKVLDVGEPERGDVVVFRYPEDPSTDYIKRVVGLPGDHIVYRNKTLYINGRPVPQRVLGPYTAVPTGLSLPAQLREEELPGHSHRIVVHPRFRGRLDRGEWWVPEGSYFVMGDNRDNSNDSRAWGFVPERYLVGKAVLIWMAWNGADGGVNWDRIGLSIR